MFGSRAAGWIDPRTPFQIAMDQLDRVEELDLPSEGRFKEHYVLVTDTVRGYLTREYSLTALDWTTSETDLALRESTVPTNEGRGIVKVLQDGDLVKFTEVVPGQEVSWEAVHRTRALIQAIRPREPEPDSVEAGTSEGA
jgi:hypothetical protein